MSLLLQPTLKFLFSGTNIATYNNTYSFNLSDKTESSYILQSTSTPITISLTSITNPYFLYVYSDGGAFTLTITIGTNVIALPSTNGLPICLPLTQAFATTITSLSLASQSVNLSTIFVSIYGLAV